MKFRIIISVLLLGMMVFTSCDEQIMDWHKDPEHGDVTVAELPLSLAEKITRYDVLKSYTDFTLGIGMGLDEYLSIPAYRKIVNDNFDQITIGYAMKHGAMVGSKGDISYIMVDSLLRVLTRNGLTCYGHTLVWHSNQNATYLNGLIADQIAVTNLLNNGTFESAGINGWSKWNGATDALSLSTTAYQGSGAMKVINLESNASSQWKTQIHSDFNVAKMTSGSSYTISYYVRSDAAGSVRCSTTGSAHYQGDQTTGTSWTKMTWTFTADGGETGLNFDLGKVAGTYYIDNVVVGLTNSPTAALADTTKTRIIGDAMKSWIVNMMTHYKDKVKAWDVVNEPMTEDGAVRDGSAATTASDQFYWQKYLGKNYAVTAFKLARQYGNGITDKLFINDYNLESSISKCKGLIDYVKYIESQGATVDGIGTQMHISITADTTKIDQMFQLLAATGKLIKVSELDIQVKTSSPTTDNLATQAYMYQYVVNSYKKYIPAAQQYGITIWGVSDNAKEHVNWIPNDAPNLWDANYARKHAYKGTADGLAGEDVSKHFTGELQY